MGKKKLSRAERRGRKAKIEAAALAAGKPLRFHAPRTPLPEMKFRPMPQGLIDAVLDGSPFISWNPVFEPKKERRKSTLPAHLTDLLNVDPPRKLDQPPRDARTGRWEDHHEFHPRHSKPTRSSFGVNCPDPPLALICPECDARQAPLMNSGFSLFGSNDRRTCKYCGVTLHLHGSRIMWWR